MKSDPFERYRCYERAAQSPFATIDLIQREYRKANRRQPLKLREDFSGSGWLAAEWVRISPGKLAVAVDNSSEPIEFGRATHLASLSRSQKKRLRYVVADVRDPLPGRFDVIVALNFSYGLLKSRAELVAYFKSVRASLAPGGHFVIDLFGGTRAQDLRVRTTRIGDLVYQWECRAFNPVQSRGVFAMHFKRKDRPRLRNAFLYDWRLWSCPELREVMEEAGFSKTTAYWEGDKPGGGGDGNFTPTEWEENSRVWRSFIIGIR